MEALLEKEGDVENWNDDRLDELSRRMDDGFAKVDKRFDRVEGEMNHRFDKVDHKFDRLADTVDKLFYIQMFFFVSLAIAVISHVVSV